jgi:DNA-binding NarL/FixJ family response regulator
MSSADDEQWRINLRAATHLSHSAGSMSGAGPVMVALGQLDPLLDRGLQQVLSEDQGLRVTDTGLSSAALERMDFDGRPTVAVLDEAIVSGSSALTDLKAAQPTIGVVVLAHQPPLAFCLCLLSRGVNCVSKATSAPDMLTAIRVASDIRRAFVLVNSQLLERSDSPTDYTHVSGETNNTVALDRAEGVRRLLTDERAVSDGILGYGLTAWHLGLIGTGSDTERILKSLQSELDCQLLCVEHDAESICAWLGGQQKSVIRDLARLASVKWPKGASLAVGEPREGLDGWRRTHREALAALPVARRRSQRLTKCADVVLEAAVLKDDVLMRSLKDVYLAPLDSLGIGADTARKTLSAYFATGHNVKAAADRLRVDRRTVWYRLSRIAERLDRLPGEPRAELDVALRVEALND